MFVDIRSQLTKYCNEEDFRFLYQAFIIFEIVEPSTLMLEMVVYTGSLEVKYEKSQVENHKRVS